MQRLLGMLQPGTSLALVVVEGISPMDKAAIERGLLQGADLTEYYGGDTFESSDRVLVTQLKYSVRKPSQAWTPARLASRGSRKQPGVVARLAEAFSAFQEGSDRQDVLKRLRLRLVSNQPAHPKLAALMALISDRLRARPQRVNLASLLGDLSAGQRRDLLRLHVASGLPKREFTDFLRVLDFDDLGTSSRWEQETSVVHTLGEHVLDDTARYARELFDLVRKQALPETSLGLTRADVLVRLGAPGEESLFPMPSRFAFPKRPIATPDAERLADALRGDTRMVIAHGDAGVGKTTTVAQLETVLPPGSAVILYDCFGGGEYLSASETRHLPQPALVQIVNELALRCGTPLLLQIPQIEARLWRHLQAMLRRARDSLTGSDARVVLVIDAADNAVVAGRVRSQRTFVPDLATLALPDGTSLVLTCRTHRIDDLQAPADAVHVQLDGFDENASAQHLRSRFPDANDVTCRLFHKNSGGNPRSQFYVLDPATAAAENDSDAAHLAKVTPRAIFDDLVDAAIKHVADPAAARVHLADLISLSRPIDLGIFASATGLNSATAESFCRGLKPGVRLEDTTVAFRDEDFETHLRSRVSEPEMKLAHGRLADHFMLRRSDDAYAAIAVAEHLRLAGRDEELVTLAAEEEQPEAVADPVARLQAYFRRLELALQVAEREQWRPSATKLILLAARAARTDQAVAAVVRSRPDLAMRHGDRDAVARIYETGDAEPWRGPLHMRVGALYARLGDNEEACEQMDLAEAWIRRRMDLEPHEHFGWRLTAEDLAAGAQAVYWVSGAEKASRWLARWRPVETMLQAAEGLALDVAREKGVDTTCEELSRVSLPPVIEARLLAAMSSAGHHPPQRTVLDVIHALSADPPSAELRNAPWTVDLIELVARTTKDPDQTLILIDGYGPDLPDRAPSEFEEMGNWHAPLRRRCLKAACCDVDVDRQAILPEELKAAAPASEKYDEQQRREQQRRRIETMLDRHLPVLQIRARALLGKATTEEIAVSIRQRLASYRESSQHRWYKGDPSYRPWAQSAVEALLAAGGDASELLDEIVDLASVVTRTSGMGVRIAVGTILIHVERYRDQALGLLDNAVSETESSEEPAGERAERIVNIAGLIDPYDAGIGSDYYGRAVIAAAGLDDEGAGVLKVNARLAASCSAAADTRAPELAERIARSVERYTPFVTDTNILPWIETIKGVAKLHPAAGLALASRWEDEDRLHLAASMESAAAPMAEQGFVRPETALVLVRLCGESRFATSAALQLLESLRCGGAPSRPHLASALRDLSLFICRDLLPSARLQAAPSIATWMTKHSLQTLPGGKELLELADFAERREEQPDESGAARYNETKASRDRIDRLVKCARHDDLKVLQTRLEEMVDLYASESQITEYLTRLGEALSPAKRVTSLEALSDIPAEDPLWRFHGESMLKGLHAWLSKWKNGKPVKTWITEQLPAALRDRFVNFIAYEQKAEITLPAIMSLPGLLDPAELLIKAVGPNLAHLSAGQLHAIASALAASMGAEQQVELLNWSLRNLEGDEPPPSAPPLPGEESEALAALLWALFGHPDRQVRWRAAHVARSLMCAPSAALGANLMELLASRTAGAFVNEGHEFLWMSAQLWLLLLLSRVAGDMSATLGGHEHRLAELALDDGWPHAAVRELARGAALKLDEYSGGSLGEEQRGKLEASNRAVSCLAKRGHHWDLGDGRHDDPDRKFRFDAMDTLPYWYSPLGRVFAVDASVIAGMAEKWIVDRLGFTENGVMRDLSETAEKYEYEDTSHGHGSAPRVERLRTYLEYHAMLLAAGELVAEGRPVSVDTYESPDDPWESWLHPHLDASPDWWTVDLRSPAPLQPSSFGDLGPAEHWRQRSPKDFDAELGLEHAGDMIVVDSYCSVWNPELHGSSFVSSALVEPEAATALVRALQTCPDPNDFRLPEVKGEYPDDVEIGEPDFRLHGWLFEHREERSNLEEADPLRRIDPGFTEPGPDFVEHHGLSRATHGRALIRSDGTEVARVVAWSDQPPSERGHRRVSYSSGRRTQARVNELLDFLIAKQMDLIFEVRITRQYAERPSREEEHKYEPGQSRIYLLRRNGALETMEGHRQLG
ncbi:MAG TPA: ATP-binding protein [Solirubrobacteraceae bacterium]|nr:ATP-binding protein [Solirubrobacteraceae bacterium]